MPDQTVNVAFELPALPYGLQGLEPYLSEETLKIHYGRHHAKYIENLNRLLAGHDLAGASLEDVLRTASESNQTALFNNAAQAWNHSFFWESMSAQSSAPEGELAQAIVRTFGNLDNLRERFIAEGVGHFGSGWVWLVVRNGAIEVLSTHDAATPITTDGTVALLTCDVWEHAYYIDYRQDRANWLATWWDKLAHWSFAGRQYAAALGEGNQWHFPSASQ